MRILAIFVLPLLSLTAMPLLASDCAALANAKLADTTITAASSVPAGNFMPPYGNPVPDVPAFCRVTGVIKPTPDSDIRFEVWLPETGWNQKYLGVGNGGFAGAIDFRQLGDNLKRGFATAATDTGHQPMASMPAGPTSILKKLTISAGAGCT